MSPFPVDQRPVRVGDADERSTDWELRVCEGRRQGIGGRAKSDDA